MSATIPCARAGCRVSLSASQIARGIRYHNRWCVAQTRRIRPQQSRARCKVCARPLTPIQRNVRKGRPQGTEHCSLRCVMRTRWGTAAPTVTHCRGCAAPLTRRQRAKRNETCSRSCAKRRQWQQQRPRMRANFTAEYLSAQRAAYVARLRAYLQGRPSRREVVRRAFWTGYRVLAARARRRGVLWPAPTGHQHRGTEFARLLRTPGTLGDLYRTAYAAGHAAAWRQWQHGDEQQAVA